MYKIEIVGYKTKRYENRRLFELWWVKHSERYHMYEMIGYKGIDAGSGFEWIETRRRKAS